MSHSLRSLALASAVFVATALSFSSAANATPLNRNSARGIDRADVTSIRHIASRTIETRDVAKFDAIRIEGIADVYLSQDKDQLVQVDAEEGTAHHVTTKVENGTLVISTDKSLSSGKPVKVYVTVPSIKALQTEGTGNFIGLTPIKAGDLSLATGGTGTIDLSVTASAINSTIQGTGNINLKGSTKAASVIVSSTGDYHGRRLAATSVSVASTGTGDVEVNATERLTIELSGTGDVRYAGEVAQVTSTISGTGTVRKLPKESSRG